MIDYIILLQEADAMKRTAAIILAFLTLVLFTACAGSGKTDSNGQTADPSAAAVSGKDYEGGWYDVVSQRCGMVITPLSDNQYKVDISWGSSAYESTEWTMTAEFDKSDGTLRYTDGKSQTVCYDTEDSEPVYDVHYTDSTGYLKFVKDRIFWSDEKDPETSDSRLFIASYEPEDFPKDIKYFGFYFCEDDASSVEIYYDKGVMMVTMDITRLASMSGTAVYDEETDSLYAVVTDPSEQPMELRLKKTDGVLTVTVENSVWDYIHNGDTFVFS